MLAVRCFRFGLLIDILAVVADTAARFDDPSRNSRYAEETENADQEEDDVVPVSRIGHIVHVLQLGNLLVEHQDLYLREQCRQNTADRQPEIDGDVAAEPGYQRSAESVPYGDTEYDRPQDGQHDQKERAERLLFSFFTSSNHSLETMLAVFTGSFV